jgi:hypothetical protein
MAVSTVGRGDTVFMNGFTAFRHGTRWYCQRGGLHRPSDEHCFVQKGKRNLITDKKLNIAKMIRVVKGRKKGNKTLSQ